MEETTTPKKTRQKKTSTSTKSKVKESDLVVEGSLNDLTDILDIFDEKEINNTEDDENNGIDINNNEPVAKARSIFEHIDGLTVNKTPWEQLRDVDKKSFDCYMILLWLGMNSDLLVFIDEIQIYGIGTLWSKRELYKVLLDFLPQQKVYIKYIKNQKGEKYNTSLVELIAKHYQVSKYDATGYLNIFFGSIKGIGDLQMLIQKYGKSEKEINKLMDNSK
jgi:hypothetical protein